MTRDKLNELIKELGLKMIWREEFTPYPNLRVLCFEEQRFVV